MEITEQFRMDQGGMGYLQFHAAVSWIRTWLTANDVSFIEHGDPARICRMMWEVADGEGQTFWLTFDHKSYGHLLYSIDRENWSGMDVTYHPSEGAGSDTNWNIVCRRIRSWVRTGHSLGQIYQLERVRC